MSPLAPTANARGQRVDCGAGDTPDALSDWDWMRKTED